MISDFYVLFYFLSISLVMFCSILLFFLLNLGVVLRAFGVLFLLYDIYFPESKIIRSFFFVLLECISLDAETRVI